MKPYELARALRVAQEGFERIKRVTDEESEAWLHADLALMAMIAIAGEWHD